MKKLRSLLEDNNKEAIHALASLSQTTALNQEISRPVFKERMSKVIEKALLLISDKREYALFNVAESHRKINFYIPDIVLVNTSSEDPRNKEVVLRDGKKFTLMDYTMERLLALSDKLVQVNRSQLVSIDMVDQVQHDLITLKKLPANRPAYINLSRVFIKDFKAKMIYQ